MGMSRLSHGHVGVGGAWAGHGPPSGDAPRDNVLSSTRSDTETQHRADISKWPQELAFQVGKQLYQHRLVQYILMVG